MKQTTFETLYQPLKASLAEMSSTIDKSYGSRTLFFIDFFKILLFYFVCKKDSLRSLVTDLKTSDVCKELGLPFIANSTLRDGFSRFSSAYFAKLYQLLLKKAALLSIPELQEFGQLYLVDGSLFPAMKQMSWARYKKTKNAVRLHLSFNLNRMIPTEFLALSGNSSERAFLLKIVEKGMTYIADRGYFSFEVIAEIAKAKAFFVLRIKENMVYHVLRTNTITGNIPSCFKQVTDQVIWFANDKNATVCRLITFQVWDSTFYILTNRFELTTLQVIILYAYRWQIELMFKFIKRTLKGIHLVNTSQNGITIQFYMLMITTILQLLLKQKCQQQELEEQQKKQEQDKKKQEPKTELEIEEKQDKGKGKYWPNKKQNPFDIKGYIQPNQWIKTLNDTCQLFWKITKQWLNTLINALTKTFDKKVIKLLSSA